jgi:hypothetical protein
LVAINFSKRILLNVMKGMIVMFMTKSFAVQLPIRSREELLRHYQAGEVQLLSMSKTQARLLVASNDETSRDLRRAFRARPMIRVHFAGAVPLVRHSNAILLDVDYTGVGMQEAVCSAVIVPLDDVGTVMVGAYAAKRQGVPVPTLSQVSTFGP